MRFLILAAALIAPNAALACAMPHYEEKELAKLMADIDSAAVPAPAQLMTIPVEAPSMIPEAQPRPSTPVKPSPPLTAARRS